MALETLPELDSRSAIWFSHGSFLDLRLRGPGVLEHFLSFPIRSQSNISQFWCWLSTKRADLFSESGAARVMRLIPGLELIAVAFPLFAVP